MSRTSLIIGPPGTGKTSRLMQEVSSALSSGTPPDRIAFLSFTKQAATEAVSRITSTLKLDPKDFKYFKTLHALAYNIIGLRRNEVMTTKHFKEFGTQHGWEFSQHYELGERPILAGKIGDQLLALYQMSKANNRTMIEEYEYGTQYCEFEKTVARDFDHHLQLFKDFNGLMDFSDFLNHVHNPIDVDLFIIDEAQDLTPQQWELAKRLAKTAKKIIIAGDDDQAIFTWAGADVRRFLGLNAPKEFLPQSYRLAKSIFDVCTGISGRITERFDKEFKPRAELGQVTFLPTDVPDHVDVRTGIWLCLGRHRSQLPGLEKMARQSGRTYFLDDVSILQSPIFQAVIRYEAMRRGEAQEVRHLETIAKHIRDFTLPKNLAGKLHYDEIKWPWQGKPDWMDALKLISPDDQEYIRSIKRNGHSLTDTPTVRITTVHGSKGAEADNVLLMTNTHRRVRMAARQFPDDERRVWYVGCSRARNHLVLAGPEMLI